MERIKTLYEQYFLGMQKQPPSHLHSDIERRIRDLMQVQIRNTGMRYRFATLQQKFGSYNSYWRRTLRQIENGTYIRQLARIGRRAAETGEEIPEEILAAMPKRMREQVKRDREAALAIARRRAEAQGLEDGGTIDTSDDAALITDAGQDLGHVRNQKKHQHVVDEGDADMDFEAFFASMKDSPGGDFGPDDTNPDAKPLTEPARAAKPSPAPAVIPKLPPAAKQAFLPAETIPSASVIGMDDEDEATTFSDGPPDMLPPARPSAPPQRMAGSLPGAPPQRAPAVPPIGPPQRQSQPIPTQPTQGPPQPPQRASQPAIPPQPPQRASQPAIPPQPPARASQPAIPPQPPQRASQPIPTQPTGQPPQPTRTTGPQPALPPQGPPQRASQPIPPQGPPQRASQPIPTQGPPHPPGQPPQRPTPMPGGYGVPPHGAAQPPQRASQPPAPQGQPPFAQPRPPGAPPGPAPRPTPMPGAYGAPPDPQTPPMFGQQQRPKFVDPNKSGTVPGVAAPPSRISGGTPVVPASRESGPIPVVTSNTGPNATVPQRPSTAPSQVTRPNPIQPGASQQRAAVPVQSMQGPFPRAPAGAPRPERPDPPLRPPPGMNDADVNALYAKYVQAKQAVGDDPGPGAYGKLLKTINAQAPKIMEQYKAKGVEFSVVVKDNQVIIKAKPKP